MDRLLDQLTELLACATEYVNPEPCRTFLNPGPGAPFDVCEEGGQLWVANTLISPNWPQPSGNPINCPTQYTAWIELGIIRCATAVIGDDMQLPDEADITADAMQQQQDRWALEQAFSCCWTIEGKDLIVDSWTPVPPQGGCVGGIWGLRIRMGGCTCQDIAS